MELPRQPQDEGSGVVVVDRRAHSGAGGSVGQVLDQPVAEVADGGVEQEVRGERRDARHLGRGQVGRVHERHGPALGRA
ncbi:hypothetical protein [Pseudonocardia endophytica]|uniref:hypothetical protein n=1 Tax=Pseudonocardia endophytica TaxID=401976 RepID=UPI00105383EE|nr:hypothetical protein [Pseudonocardia endophytica]